MELSARVEYALFALLKLADRRLENKPLTVNQMAIDGAITERYLDQILIALRRQGLVRSQRGVKGGYVLAKTPAQITWLEILHVFEKNTDLQPAEQIDPITLEKTVVIDTWLQVSQAYRSILASYTLADLARCRQELQQKDPMYHI